MSQELVPAVEKEKKWLRIIAIWSLLTAALGFGFYLLVLFSDIEKTFTILEHVDVAVSTILNILICIGLWRSAGWGWKVAVISIPLVWMYSIYTISTDYKPGAGLFFSFFLFIDTAILHFLFRKSVRNILNISSRFWSGLHWIKYPLFFSAIFLLLLDFFGNGGSALTALFLFASIRIVQKIRSRQQGRQ